MNGRGTLFTLVFCAACGGGATPAAGPVGPAGPAGSVGAVGSVGPVRTTAGGPVLVSAPAIPQGAFDVAPGELGDAAVYTRLRHRMRITRLGLAYLTLGGPRADHVGAARVLSGRKMLPVIGETTDRIRVVVEEDHVRMALWLDRADAAVTTLAPVQVADASGHAPQQSGLWLGAGASLDADLRAGASGFREVTLRSQWLQASGYVPAVALGAVWIAGEREGYEPTTAEVEGAEPASTGSTVAASAVRATADAHGDIVAQIAKAAPVRVVRVAGAWTEIEVHVPRIRVHGFVPSAAVSAGDHAEIEGQFGFGGAYGMSDTRRIDVPRGACLYDGPSGEVVGVNVAPTERYVTGGEPAPGWWPVVVALEWGQVIAWVHDSTGGKDPKAAVLESCTGAAAKP